MQKLRPCSACKRVKLSNAHFGDHRVGQSLSKKVLFERKLLWFQKHTIIFNRINIYDLHSISSCGGKRELSSGMYGVNSINGRVLDFDARWADSSATSIGTWSCYRMKGWLWRSSAIVVSVIAATHFDVVRTGIKCSKWSSSQKKLKYI